MKTVKPDTNKTGRAKRNKSVQIIIFSNVVLQFQRKGPISTIRSVGRLGQHPSLWENRSEV